MNGRTYKDLSRECQFTEVVKPIYILKGSVWKFPHASIAFVNT